MVIGYRSPKKLIQKSSKVRIWVLDNRNISFFSMKSRTVSGGVRGEIHTVLVAQLCPILYDPMPCSPPGSSVHEILQARILECVVIPFSRESSQPRDQTWVSQDAGMLFTV